MGTRLKVADAVALPCPPELAVCVADGGTYLDGALPSPLIGEVLHVTSGAPDGKLIYVVAHRDSGVAEGWVPGSAIRLLATHEVPATTSRLPLPEALKRCTLAEVTEDWQDFEAQSPNALSVRAGERLQVSTVRQNWGYGWLLEAPGRRGWFPLAVIRKMESTMEKLVESKQEVHLSVSASAALCNLLQSAPPPPPRLPAWQGELPQIVAESAQLATRAMQEEMEHTQAEAAMAAEEAGASLEPRQEEGPSNTLPSLVPEELPEDCYPLVVCQTAFVAPKGSAGALLPLAPGDLARVTSMLDCAMYHGFLEGRPTQRGWFPRRNVSLLEDPLSSTVDNLPVHIGAPPLPQVPPSLLQKRALA